MHQRQNMMPPSGGIMHECRSFSRGTKRKARHRRDPQAARIAVPGLSTK
jgi:hypothetical protein